MKSYFLKGITIEDVLELTMELLPTVAPTQPELRKGNKGLEVALFYKSSAVVGRNWNNDDSYVLQVCMSQGPDGSWEITTIYPGEEPISDVPS